MTNKKTRTRSITKSKIFKLTYTNEGKNTQRKVKRRPNFTHSLPRSVGSIVYTLSFSLLVLGDGRGNGTKGARGAVDDGPQVRTTTIPSTYLIRFPLLLLQVLYHPLRPSQNLLHPPFCSPSSSYCRSRSDVLGTPVYTPRVTMLRRR